MRRLKPSSKSSQSASASQGGAASSGDSGAAPASTVIPHAQDMTGDLLGDLLDLGEFVGEAALIVVESSGTLNKESIFV